MGYPPYRPCGCDYCICRVYLGKPARNRNDYASDCPPCVAGCHEDTSEREAWIRDLLDSPGNVCRMFI